jgi:hypothetical protein
MGGARQIALGPLIAVGGAVLLLVSLFLDWYDDLSAWTVFEVLDLALAAIAVLSLVSLAERLGVGPARGRIIGAGAALPLGAAAVVVVVSQLINHPPAGVDRDPGVGLWLALAGSALILAGSSLAAARISLAVDVERRGPRSPDPDAPTTTAPPEPPPGEEPLA